MKKRYLATALSAMFGLLFFVSDCDGFKVGIGTEDSLDLGPQDAEHRPESAPLDGGDSSRLEYDFGDNSFDKDSSTGEEGHCWVPPAPPMGVDVITDYWNKHDVLLTNWAEVIFLNHWGGADFSSEAWLLLDDGSVVKLLALLPGRRELPLHLGQRLYAYISIEQPWWTNSEIKLMNEDDLVLFEYVSREDYGRYDYLCPPVDDGCGELVSPLVELAGTTVHQGETIVFEQHGYPTILFVGWLHKYLSLYCDDLPEGWIEYMILCNAFDSQCFCRDDVDCLPGEICEPSAGRCIPNVCEVMECQPGLVCDPYSGECVEPTAVPCYSDSDCGDMALCNRYTGACVQDICKNMVCAPCSSLAGGCRGCFSDCDCPEGEVCRRDTRTCEEDCDLDKLVLDRQNTSGATSYVVCFDARLADPAELAGKYDPSLDCRTTELPSGICPRGQNGCLGDLDLEPDSNRIVQSFWQRLCRLSHNPLVIQVKGFR